MARFFWLYSKTLEHRQDRLAGSNGRVDDVSTEGVLAAAVSFLSKGN